MAAFDTPQWAWKPRIETDIPLPRIGHTVTITDGMRFLGRAETTVPGEFLTYVRSLHGSEVEVTGFYLDRVAAKRWKFGYVYVTPAEADTRMVLWHWTNSQLPNWARQTVGRI